MSAAEILKSVPSSVRVLAVSKLQPSAKIRDLHTLSGHLDFGENYVQEALSKQIELGDLPLRWHLIGSLQTNKVKSIVGKFELLHAVDSVRLAEKISAEALRQNLVQKVLFQVNVGGEDSKSGFAVDDYEAALSGLLALPGLDIRGLMTMPPLSSLAEDNRAYFRSLKRLSGHLVSLRPVAHELSMGTSGDYLVAIEEGATIVRLGSVLFGERPAR